MGAILKEGQYRGAYVIDKHRGQYPALCQNGSVQSTETRTWTTSTTSTKRTFKRASTASTFTERRQIEVRSRRRWTSGRPGAKSLPPTTTLRSSWKSCKGPERLLETPSPTHSSAAQTSPS